MKNFRLKSSAKMIKLFSLCLALCLIFTSFAAFAAEETTETAEATETTETTETTENTEESTEPEETTDGTESAEGEETEEPASEPEPEVVYGTDSYGLLNALGIAEYTEDQLTNTITRADFLALVGAAAGYTGVESSEQLFADLALDDAREPMLKALAQAGVISPDASGNIIPDGEITLAEAAAVAVRLTGYSIVAEARGGYPSGYFTVAKSNDILKGVPSSQGTVLTVGMAAKLTENMLKSNLML